MMEEWNDGMMEEWNDGIEKDFILLRNIPVFQYSN